MLLVGYYNLFILSLHHLRCDFSASRRNFFRPILLPFSLLFPFLSLHFSAQPPPSDRKIFTFTFSVRVPNSSSHQWTICSPFLLRRRPIRQPCLAKFRPLRSTSPRRLITNMYVGTGWLVCELIGFCLQWGCSFFCILELCLVVFGICVRGMFSGSWMDEGNGSLTS